MSEANEATQVARTLLSANSGSESKPSTWSADPNELIPAHTVNQAISLLKDRIRELETELETVRSQQPPTPAPASGTPAAIPTPDTTLEAMGQIMQDLASGKLSAADGKARLYAHQIALSAMRTIDTAKARRQKEERLRQTKNRSPRTISQAAASHASRRREAQRQDKRQDKRQTTTKKTTGRRRKK